MFSSLNLYIGIATGAVVAGTLAYFVGHWNGEVAGKNKYVAAQAVASAKAEAERRNDDAKLQGLSDYDICVQYLAARKLSIDPCDELRGVHAE